MPAVHYQKVGAVEGMVGRADYHGAFPLDLLGVGSEGPKKYVTGTEYAV